MNFGSELSGGWTSRPRPMMEPRPRRKEGSGCSDTSLRKPFTTHTASGHGERSHKVNKLNECLNEWLNNLDGIFIKQKDRVLLHIQFNLLPQRMKVH